MRRLSFEEKKDLRKKIEEELKNYNGQERIPLPKELLEQLLFETITIQFEDDDFHNKKLSRKQVRAKFIVWSGSFLSKIKLNEISFDNVSWDIRGCIENDITFKEECIEEIKKVTEGNFKVDLSNTNATIDFSKSFYSIIGLGASIDNCNFENVNLSNNTLTHAMMGHSNFSNTGLKIVYNTQTTKAQDDFVIFDCNMTGTDLSECIVTDVELCDTMRNSNFNGTGLKVIMNKGKEIQQVYVGQEIKKGHLDGCYVNGVLIKTEEQRKKQAEELRNNEDTTIDSIMDSVRETIKGMKK